MADVRIPLEVYNEIVNTTRESVELARRSMESADQANATSEKLVIAFNAERKATKVQLAAEREASRRSARVKWILIFSLIATLVVALGGKWIFVNWPFG